MRLFAILFALLLSASVTAIAQSTPQPSTAQEQIERIIGNLIIANASLQEQLRQSQAALAQMKAAEDERTKSDAALRPALPAPSSSPRRQAW